MKDRRAKRPLRAAAALAVVFGVAAAPGAARAQFFGGWGGWDNGGTWDGLAPGQVRRAIGQQGFRVLAPLRRNGSVYVADVIDGRGRHERLIVAAADAQILQRFIVEDGRGGFPQGADEGRGFAARGTDDDRALVPPADIPDAGRRAARPFDRVAPAPRFGDLGTDGDDGSPAAGAPADADPTLRRPAPPLRIVKPRPRVVERAPEDASPVRQPGAVESTPLAPAAPRPAAAAPAPFAKEPPPAPAPTAVASRPEPASPAAAPASSAPAASVPVASRHPSDPLAIPGGEEPKPVRNVAAGITGTPVAAPAKAAAPAGPAAPARSGDVPVAPLD